MNCVKMRFRGVERLINVSDSKAINKRVEEGYAPVLGNDGLPLIVEFNGQKLESNGVSPDTTNILDNIAKALEKKNAPKTVAKADVKSDVVADTKK